MHQTFVVVFLFCKVDQKLPSALRVTSDLKLGFVFFNHKGVVE